MLPDPKAFEAQLDDKDIRLFILTAKSSGAQCAITNYGARIVSLLVPDRAGAMTDVVLGYNGIAEYMGGPEDYMGAIVGRCANRIAGGRFELDGRHYVLPKNNGENTLHGGLRGLHARVWDVVAVSEDSLSLHYVSLDGEEGFPGNLPINVTYRLEAPATLVIEYSATTDVATPVNLSNHTYWNLSGEGCPTIEDHVLLIAAQRYTPVDNTLIPTGEEAKVAGTPFYFCDAHPIGAHLGDVHDQLLYGKGYDHNWIIDSKNGGHAVEVESPLTGIKLLLSTDRPGLQFYSGNFLDGSRSGKSGAPYPFRSALVLEPQGFPDAVNHPEFPSVILRPGEQYSAVSKYEFSAKG